ncbi:peptidoglycan-binding protein [Pseudomonas oryzihabitans]|uniref:peptidoglycan-associated lipoprotein Pal n=1 Tax=Pseudomonas rhizoryzae TaxID=2571129 RepID=UPI000735EE13|nr:peptidoglycan-associated lipoprotein Pal [Pseudomonas rhizoryzae]APQ11091.1 peptidoglycan-associated lipoprotein [Pseudomonas psychrotolerans]KTS76488.1 peptidoglycan-binding protein [Pseudomonas psychrotolerans]KTT00625.1 peptidoglycan-binding protein [Pseudomonas psychrotolerans]KTT12976.1 peptidoglycan-binding protein [Pseudomonas psychrotolerans]KTT25421.1 peptidoglycan-binding protein [Pseudomonas psychrotolerans]
MEMLKFGKFAALALAMAVAVGCSSKGGDASGEGAGAGAGAVDPNAGYGANAGAVDGSMGDEAALRNVNTFYFAFDSSDLRPDAMRALDVHAKDLKASGQRVVLNGYTDERGTAEYNMALGERRAQAVQRYLVLQGVSPAQLEVVSYGKTNPVCVQHDESCWAQNRRVVLVK